MQLVPPSERLHSEKSAKRQFIPAGIALLCLTLIGLIQMPQLERLKTQSQTATVESLRQHVEQEQVRLTLLKKLPAFGFDNVLADWTFLNFLQYFGDAPARAKTDFTLSPDYFEVVLGRDPYFLNAYTFLSTSSALYAGMPERSVAIARQGLSSLQPNVPPESYYAWRQLGIDELLFLGDAQAAKKSFETAASWARQSSAPGSDRVAALSEQTAAFLANNPESKTAQVSAWAMVLMNASDKRTHDTAISKIQALGGKVIPNPNGTFAIQPPTKD
ncbi:MAG: hypothetical protein KME11_04440 [Timaviella obliquedivisa GSE-PSE-MK23-08B]|jgi:hypothetical protein|nr:hypothetical protein [Timaviella obliquedivisa GSE-PSE-MK23-08B]